MLLVAILGMPGCRSPVDQSAACADYVACIQARDAEQGVSTNLDRYLAGGDCWGNAEIGDLCDRSCENGLDWLRSAEATLPEACLP